MYGTHYLDMSGEVPYPTPEMQKELKRYIPEPVTHCRLKDKSMFIAENKEQGIYPLSMPGVLMDRHAAWVISRLENLCCLLEYNDMVLNALDVENLFVDPVNHQIYLYGGWRALIIYVFHQLGGGSCRRCPTYWSEAFLPDLLKLGEEMQEFTVEAGIHPAILAHPECACVTVFDVLLNSLTEEQRRKARLLRYGGLRDVPTGKERKIPAAS